MRPYALLALGMLVFTTGCPDKKPAHFRPPVNVAAVPAANDAPAQEKQPGGGGADRDDKGKQGGKEAAEMARRIKYTADIKVICADFPKAEEGMKAARPARWPLARARPGCRLRHC